MGMNSGERRGPRRGLETKGALQHWTVAVPNTRCRGFEQIHPMFFWGSAGREDGDPSP